EPRSGVSKDEATVGPHGSPGDANIVRSRAVTGGAVQIHGIDHGTRPAACLAVFGHGHLGLEQAAQHRRRAVSSAPFADGLAGPSPSPAARPPSPRGSPFPALLLLDFADLLLAEQVLLAEEKVRGAEGAALD